MIVSSAAVCFGLVVAGAAESTSTSPSTSISSAALLHSAAVLSAETTPQPTAHAPRGRSAASSSSPLLRSSVPHGISTPSMGWAVAPAAMVSRNFISAAALAVAGLALTVVLRHMAPNRFPPSPPMLFYGAVGSTLPPIPRMALGAVAGTPTSSRHRLSLAIIFDIDGTLCDSFQLGFNASNKVLQANGHNPITAEAYHAGTKYTTPVRLAWHAGYEWDSEEFKAAGAKLGAEFDEYYVGLVGPATAAFYPHVRSLVQQLGATCHLGVLTNAAAAYAHAVLQANNVHALFDVVHGADDVPAPKPEPDGLLRCCAELGIRPSQAIYVGDSPSDGAAARAAGMQSVGVAWGSHPVDTLEENFDVVVRSAPQLRRMLLAALRQHRAASSVPEFPAFPPLQPDSPSSSPWLFLLDRDGVINADVGSPGVLNEGQLRILPGVAEAIATLNRRGHTVVVVTNQTALRKGLLEDSTLQELHQAMRWELFDTAGAHVDGILVASGREDCPLRPKPAPDMLLEASRLAGISLSRAVMVGDSECDREAAQNAGCARFIHIAPHSGECVMEGVVAPNLTAAVDRALCWITDEIPPPPPHY